MRDLTRTNIWLAAILGALISTPGAFAYVQFNFLRGWTSGSEVEVGFVAALMVVGVAMLFGFVAYFVEMAKARGDHSWSSDMSPESAQAMREALERQRESSGAPVVRRLTERDNDD